MNSFKIRKQVFAWCFQPQFHIVDAKNEKMFESQCYTTLQYIINLFSPRPAKTVPFVILLCLMLFYSV